MSVDVDDNI